MDSETFKWFASLGVGGILAWGMFFVHRKDTQAWLAHLREERDASRHQNEILMNIVKENSATIATNTAATRSNTEMLQIMKSDLLDSFARAGHLERRSREEPVDPDRDRRRT
jgi:hypothetical protein